ncbi:MAG: sterol desaturase family protein [Planctomycetales bacterium]|nr:sterol desaturase family protein [Planctomycetales bacterium]
MSPPPDKAFGQGWISGTASVAMATVGLLAVFCFHFPSYLTIPDVREYYPLPIIRALLHVVLVAAFLLGLTSVMLRQNKSLGMLGMGLVLIAAILGGSRVQLDAALKDDYYLGLDYALLILIVYSAIFIPIEKLFGRLEQSVFRQGWRVDATYFFVSTLLVQLTTYLTLRPAFVLFNWAIHPTVQAWVTVQPMWLQFFEIMFLADLVQYWVHRSFHMIPWLWKFHAVHHSAQVMDWMAGNRLHLVDLAVTRSLIYIPAYVLGFDELPMVAYIVFVSVSSVFIHANLGFDFGKWGYVFTTPQFHHWHHGADDEAIDKNFAVHFPILDIVFGTFFLPRKRWPDRYGVKDNDVPESFLAQLIYPFLPTRKRSGPESVNPRSTDTGK